jgi:hypothetical protein
MCPLRKELWLDGCLGVEHRSVGIAFAEELCDLEELILAEVRHHCGVSERCPFLNYTAIFALQLRKSMKNLSQRSQVVPDATRCAEMARGWLQTALDRRKGLRSYRTRGFPHELTLGRSSEILSWYSSWQQVFITLGREYSIYCDQTPIFTAGGDTLLLPAFVKVNCYYYKLQNSNLLY